MSSASPRIGVDVGQSAGTLLRRLLHRLPRFLSTAILFVVAFAAIAVAIGAAAGMRLRVEQSGSMAPMINTGDLVIVKSIPVSAVSPGDVIGVRTSLGQVIVHRVKTISTTAGQLTVATQGDANPVGEEWQIPKGESVALVKGVFPAVGSLVDRVQGPLAALAVLLAGLLLAVFQLRLVWRRT